MIKVHAGETTTPKPGDHVFRYWWNKQDELRRFMIGFYGDGEHFLIIDAEQSKVYFRNDQLDAIIAALQHVRKTMDASNGTPSFEYPHLAALRDAD